MIALWAYQMSTRSREGKARVLTRINDNLTARDQKWLIRIILKDLKISLGEKMVLSCIHQDAIDLFNVCSDLRAVCWKLWDPLKRLPTEVCEPL
jgi:DNA ligase-4